MDQIISSNAHCHSNRILDFIVFPIPSRWNSHFKSIIPGLIFIHPDWIKIITNIDIQPIEGAFWSLFVEVKFYLIFGLFFYLFGKIKAIIGISGMYLFWFFTQLLPRYHYLREGDDLFSFEHFGWFASGALAYLFYVHKQKKFIMYAIAMGFLAILQLRSGISAFLTASVILGMFIAPIYFNKLESLYSHKILMFFGFISYPLYLIHENALISMLVSLHKNFPIIPDIFLPLIPISILCFIAYLIAKFLEPFIRKLIKPMGDRVPELSKKKCGVNLFYPIRKIFGIVISK